ncbi:hypothetical protein [Aliiroseovarius sp. F47248L]|uniref:hypothetical protein n=1 Tax=Aliiroseovarius sp. F47248L TaxID=2926420 RepID=UPI001FF0EFAB|nr:hypothetical protein [Aliiroseovarius sp. F47248L]MCK0138011.1 hypothetical protein [Aliiroseovarius sp. F47248L]
MAGNYEIFETDFLGDRIGKRWEQEIVVSRGREAFLRFAGDGAHYRVMTATTGQDDLGLRACRDPDRLMNAARELALKKVTAVDDEPPVDCQGRKYVRLFTFSQDVDVSDAQFTCELHELLVEFFDIYDNLEGKR